MSAAPATTAVLTRSATLNPVAKLVTALVIAGALVLSVDWVSALTALGLEIVLLFALGIRPLAFLTRSVPVVVAAALTAVTIALYGQVSGQVYWHVLFATVSEGSLSLALATFLRVLAIALPSILLFVDVQPVELADGLGQVVRLPPRFVIGALAGLRLVGLLGDDWRYLGYARRARGVADRGRIRRFAGQAFALLVFAVRRGSKLATAMEARGFGAFRTRSWARESHVGLPEAVLVGSGVCIAAAAIAVAVAAGTWNFIGAR